MSLVVVRSFGLLCETAGLTVYSILRRSKTPLEQMSSHVSIDSPSLLRAAKVCILLQISGESSKNRNNLPFSIRVVIRKANSFFFLFFLV